MRPLSAVRSALTSCSNASSNLALSVSPTLRLAARRDLILLTLPALPLVPEQVAVEVQRDKRKNLLLRSFMSCRSLANAFAISLSTTSSSANLWNSTATPCPRDGCRGPLLRGYHRRAVSGFRRASSGCPGLVAIVEAPGKDLYWCGPERFRVRRRFPPDDLPRRSWQRRSSSICSSVAGALLITPNLR